MTLAGKVVAVTGAARGLGRAYCEALGATGARVVAIDRDDPTETAAASGAGALALLADVVDVESLQAVAARVDETCGRIDGLVNNAGMWAGIHGGRFDAIDPDEWDRCMEVNVKGVWNVTRVLAGLLRRSAAASVVNVASTAATYGMPYALHYAASKAAVIGMTRSLARELGRENIRVNAIAPTAVVTDSAKQFFADNYQRAMEVIKRDQALQRNPEPADLVGTVLYLLSDASGFVTGQTIQIDGGNVLK